MSYVLISQNVKGVYGEIFNTLFLNEDEDIGGLSNLK